MEQTSRETIINLARSFAGESQANTRYTIYAGVARKEGREWIARIFEETAANEAVHAEEFLEMLQKLDIQLVVLAGCMIIFTEELVQTYPNAVINVHPALIPSFCGQGYYGLRVHEAVLQKGVKVTGATIHFVNEITDGGDIIAQKAVDVLPDDTPETLQKRVMVEAEWVLLPQVVETVAKSLS